MATGQLLGNSIKIDVCWHMFKSDQKYEKNKSSKIISTFCALINSYGGQVTLLFDGGDVSSAKKLEQTICQKFASAQGYLQMRDAIQRISLCQANSTMVMVFDVAGMSSLCTLHYNIYIPMKLQAVPLQSASEVKEIIHNKNVVKLDNLVKPNHYHKDFVDGKALTDDPLESKTMQFKLVCAEKRKKTTLGDRMVSNNFTHCVSAFANHRGGHVYFGVDDDGIVRGENVQDRDDVIRKISKAIDKLIWPSGREDGGKFEPVQGKNWEIFFEAVKDGEGRNKDNMFVIVIYIAFCPGGVFAMKPESYHIENGNVARIPFVEWKRRVVQTACQIHPIGRSKFTTTASETVYYTVMENMMNLRNQGENIKPFRKYISEIKERFPTVNVHLSTLSQEATYAFRKGEFRRAKELIKEYDGLTSNCEENMLVPSSMGCYIKSANMRAQGKHEESYELAKCGLQEADNLSPGLIQAWFCTHLAMLANILATEEKERERREELVMEAKRFLGLAISYSNHVKKANKFTVGVADMQQKIYIHLSELYIGLSLSGSLASSDDVSKEDVSLAETCLSKVEELELAMEGHALSPLRTVQYLLARSGLYYRHFQLGITSESGVDNLEMSREKCNEALKLASENNFKEMIGYCERLKTLIES